ncbi:MAG: aconitate hydratase [Verrucomicrobia bacterium]|nr:MAG: aconitate hydratase [Verrucomicrobiota bacterium]PYJ33769.1 MAG: aconitate hydratase [Verrucomicrobiota bacterium]
MHDEFKTLRKFDAVKGREGLFYSLPALEEQGVGKISRLPVSIRIVLESVLRNCDGKKARRKDVETLANWNAKSPANEEIPFVVARIVLQDFTGVPLVVDLAAMRSAVQRLGRDPKIIEPLVPVDLVVDHSVQVDFFGSPRALQLNLDMEFKRNRERYQFLKWGQQAFKTFQLIPPGIGIVHQVNLEYLAKGVLSNAGFQPVGPAGVSPASHSTAGKMPVGPATGADALLYYPDTLVGTDSHTTMINGLGVVGWGVGGIEAEAGMLGQPVYFLTPEVVGVHMSGQLREGVTATDLVLHITQLLRAQKVVGKFVEFYGEGAASLPVPDRATIGNMSPEYGATMGYFPIDQESVNYLRATGRSEEQCLAFENYFRAQKMFGMPLRGEIDYSVHVDLDLAEVQPSVAGPKRPQDRINLPELGKVFRELLQKPVQQGGYGKQNIDLHEKHLVELNGSAPRNGAMFSTDNKEDQGIDPGDQLNKIEMIANRPTPDTGREIEDESREVFARGQTHIGQGSVLIAAITSCTNTSNPSVMIAAGLLAKKAVERGLHVDPSVKTSLAPGSRVVSDYLEKTGLQKYLNQLGFNLVGYGCTTCIGNSGPLHPNIEKAIHKYDLVAASVLSGNRNFEARVHQHIKANFLMSPPLVVAFALAGRVHIDLSRDPLGRDKNGKETFLRDLWPTLSEIRDTMQSALAPETFRKLYRDFANQNPKWNEIPSSTGDVYQWDEKSDYIHEPPFFQNFSMEPGHIMEIRGARALGIFGDSITTDHISPAGAIKETSPAGKYLMSRGIQPRDFNSYGSRRGNDLVMTRGTFANVRIKNLMVPGTEGGVTKYFGPSRTGGSKNGEGEQMSIFDAAMKYAETSTPLVILAGHEYGSGSSRDWAAKGTRLLGVKAVVAASFERIHRSNLVGMGVLPLQFPEGTTAQSLGLDGSEIFSITGLSDANKPGQNITLQIEAKGQSKRSVPLKLRIDTPIEIDYYKHGGILPFVLRQLLSRS